MTEKKEIHYNVKINKNPQESELEVKRRPNIAITENADEVNTY